MSFEVDENPITGEYAGARQHPGPQDGAVVARRRGCYPDYLTRGTRSSLA